MLQGYNGPFGFSGSYATIVNLVRCNAAGNDSDAVNYSFVDGGTIILTSCEGNSADQSSPVAGHLVFNGCNDSSIYDFEANGVAQAGTNTQVSIQNLDDVVVHRIFIQGLPGSVNAPIGLGITNCSRVQVIGGYIDGAVQPVVIDGTGGAAHDIVLQGLGITLNGADMGSTKGAVYITNTSCFNIVIAGNSFTNPEQSIPAIYDDSIFVGTALRSSIA